MYKNFREKKSKCVYLPVELIDAIQERANVDYSNFNKVVAEVLLKEFLLMDNKSEKRHVDINT